MKKLFCIVLLFVSISINAQTADEVVEKYITAMGGLDAFKKVNTVKMTGILITQGNNLPMTTQIVQGKAMRTDVKIAAQTITNVYNNGKGWKVNPLGGAPTPTDVTGTELNSFKSQATLINLLMDYKEQGHQVELAGQEEVGGIKIFKIKLTNKEDGKVTMYFINSVTNLLNKTVSKKEMQGVETDVETYFTNMRDIDGLKFSMLILQKKQGQIFQQIKWDKIELNTPIDEKIFEK